MHRPALFSVFLLIGGLTAVFVAPGNLNSYPPQSTAPPAAATTVTQPENPDVASAAPSAPAAPVAPARPEVGPTVETTAAPPPAPEPLPPEAVPSPPGPPETAPAPPGTAPETVPAPPEAVPPGPPPPPEPAVPSPAPPEPPPPPPVTTTTLAAPDAAEAIPIDDLDEVAPSVPSLAQGGGATGASPLLNALESLMATAPAGGCIVVSRAGEPIFYRNPEALLVPASLQKLVLAAAALEILGANHVFTTSVLASGRPIDGLLEGDLYLLGGGDPLLSTPHFVEMLAAGNFVGTPLDQLAAGVTSTGLSAIAGGVVAVADRYDSERNVPHWPSRFAAQNVSGSLSAAGVNLGLVAPLGIVTAWGLAPHPTPALAAAADFDDLLEARTVRIPELPSVAAAGGDYSELVTLATVASAPLANLLRYILTESDNTAAELLLKELGYRTRGRGSTAAGASAAHAVLADDIAGLVLPADGSGLSPQNRLSCRQTTDLLDNSGPGGPLVSYLAIAGRTGTMENRYRNSSVAGLVRAKTGSLNGVASLAGFATAPDGVPLTFAVILNSDDDWLNGGPFFARLLEVLVSIPHTPS